MTTNPRTPTAGPALAPGPCGSRRRSGCGPRPSARHASGEEKARRTRCWPRHEQDCLLTIGEEVYLKWALNIILQF